ncbi:MAG: TonB-dependent receptor [Proteobacteria bacterium]|nr:TonB-dependent receptor [Pseudomonadota bacterium]
MSKSNKAYGAFGSTIILLIAGFGLYSGPVLAQQDGANAIEEIIVSARRIEESLQDIPASVTVLTEQDIQRAGISRAEDFIRLTPGVSMVNAAEVADTQVNIRGMNGSRDAENSFAFIVDGVLMSNPAAFNREYLNLKQIEVLKGPQGALYGRNAAAGAIVVTTREPGDEMETLLKASFAGDGTNVVSAYIAGPAGAGDTQFSVQGDFRNSDGYYRNTVNTGNGVDNFESFNINGRLLLHPNENLKIDLKARYGEVDAASITFNAAFALPTFTTFGLPGGEFFFEDVNTHNFLFQGNIDPQNDQQTLELSAKFDQDLANGMNLTGWMLYSDIENSLSSDGTSGAFGFFNFEPTCIQTSTALFNSGFTLPPPQLLFPSDGSFMGIFPIFGPYTPTSCDGTQYQERNQKDLSFELRLSSDPNQRLRWQTGFYYLNIDREVGVNLGIDTGQGVTNSLFVPQTGTNPTEQLVWDQFDTDVWAVFGQLQYDMSDDVELSLALRYDKEKRDVHNLVPVGPTTQYVDFTLDGVFSGGAPLNPGLDPTINPSGVISDQSATFDEFQPKISMTWDFNDQWTAFGSWGVGFKAGGFNNQGSSATVDLFFNQPLGLDLVIDDQFREETSSAFEIGLKSVANGGRVRFQAAYYHTNIDDMQFFEFLVGPFGLLRVVSNIDDVSIDGFEIGIDASLNDWLTIAAGFNWIDSEIEANSSRPSTVGNESPATPEYNHNLAALIDFPISGDMDFFANLYYTMIGDTWFHTMQNNTRTTVFDLFFPGAGTADWSLSKRGSYETLDVRLGIRSGNWTVAAVGNNITDEKFLEEVIVAAEFGGSFIHPGTQSRWGVEFTYAF